MANAETWKRRVEEWRASGVTAETFCAQREFKRSALYAWSTRLKSDVQGSMPLVRLVPQRAEVRPPRTESSIGVVVEYAGARLLVGASADEAALALVLDVLEARARRASR